LNGFDFPLVLETRPPVEVRSHVGAKGIQLTLHVVKLRFQNTVLSLDIVQELRILRVFEFYILNFVLDRRHFFDELPLFVQFLLGFGQLLIPVRQLLL
jgi:hypothetical protein